MAAVRELLHEGPYDTAEVEGLLGAPLTDLYKGNASALQVLGARSECLPCSVLMLCSVEWASAPLVGAPCWHPWQHAHLCPTHPHTPPSLLPGSI